MGNGGSSARRENGLWLLLSICWLVALVGFEYGGLSWWWRIPMAGMWGVRALMSVAGLLSGKQPGAQ